jgi:Cell division protein FtsQ
MSARAATPAGRRKAASRTARAGSRAQAPRKTGAPRASTSPKTRPGRGRPARGAKVAKGRRPTRPRAGRLREAGLSGRKSQEPARSRPVLRAGWVRWIAVAVLVLAVAYFAWFRHSSLVTGSSASSQGPSVTGPVALVRAGGEAVPVAADGRILRTSAAKGSGSLPQISVDRIPAGGRLGGAPLAEARVVGAAPGPLRHLIDGVDSDASNGVVLRMRGGLELRFGDASAVGPKWAAAAAVLADRRLTAARYIDVRVPRRPAVG